MRPFPIGVTLACLLAAAQPAHGQSSWSADLSGGAGSDAWRVALSLPWRLPVGQRLVLGAGPRLTYYAGSPARYRNRGEVTAGLPSRVTVDPAVLGLNLMVLGELKLVRSVAVGANIDLAGVAIGPSRSVGGAEFAPAHGSLLLYGNADRGSLNSEFYLAVKPAPAWTIRGGFSHYVTGYRGKAGAESARYLRFDSVGFLALAWTW